MPSTIPTQATTKTSPLAFSTTCRSAKIAFHPSFALPRQPPTQQRCNNFNPVYRSIPQLPNLLFVSFQWTFLFHYHQMPQTHSKTAKSTCISPQVCQVVEQTFALCPKAVLCVLFCQAKYALFCTAKQLSSLQLVAINIYNLRRIFAQKNPP